MKSRKCNDLITVFDCKENETFSSEMYVDTLNNQTKFKSPSPSFNGR